MCREQERSWRPRKGHVPPDPRVDPQPVRSWVTSGFFLGVDEKSRGKFGAQPQ